MSNCYEIVSFAFKTTTPVGQQHQLMATIGEFARRQPGFMARSCYYDPKANRWTDLVTWRSAEDAVNAMAHFDKAPETADAMKALDPTSIQSCHYDQVA